MNSQPLKFLSKFLKSESLTILPRSKSKHIAKFELAIFKHGCNTNYIDFSISEELSNFIEFIIQVQS